MGAPCVPRPTHRALDEAPAHRRLARALWRGGLPSLRLTRDRYGKPHAPPTRAEHRRKGAEVRVRAPGRQPLRALRGGIYVLTFWSTLNKDTSVARPEFEQMARDYENEGVSFAAVYVNNAPEDEQDAPYAVLQDGAGVL